MSKCLCYAQPDSGLSNVSQQYCASQHSDGLVYGCAPSDCSRGCPGQDPDAPSAPPDKFAPKDAHVNLDVLKPEKKEREKLPGLLLGFLILLVILVLTGLIFYLIGL
jgi:hypothetical protein